MRPMLPYPSSTKPGAAENSLMRVLGGVLALMSILLTLLGIIVHQRVPDLILAVIVGIFALRVLILWLGDKPQQQPFPVRSSMDTVTYPMQSSPSTQGHSTAYIPLNSQPQSFYRNAPELYEQPTMPMPSVAVESPPLKLPRSIRPQQPPNASPFPTQLASPPEVVQPVTSSQPTSLWLPPPNASVPMSSQAPVSSPSQEGNWQYDDGENYTQQQRGNDYGTT